MGQLADFQACLFQQVMTLTTQGNALFEAAERIRQAELAALKLFDQALQLRQDILEIRWVGFGNGGFFTHGASVTDRGARIRVGARRSGSKQTGAPIQSLATIAQILHKVGVQP